MSEINNGRLSLYGAEQFKCNHMMKLGFIGLRLYGNLRLDGHEVVFPVEGRLSMNKTYTDTLFSCCDFDLGPVALICEFDLDILNLKM